MKYTGLQLTVSGGEELAHLGITQALEVDLLAAGPDGRRQQLGCFGAEDEHGARGRFLDGLQQRGGSSLTQSLSPGQDRHAAIGEQALETEECLQGLSRRPCDFAPIGTYSAGLTVAPDGFYADLLAVTVLDPEIRVQGLTQGRAGGGE